MDEADPHIRRMLDVLNFIGWHDPDHIQGGIKAEQAFNSMCELMHLPPGKMLNLVRGKPQPEDPAHDPR